MSWEQGSKNSEVKQTYHFNKKFRMKIRWILWLYGQNLTIQPQFGMVLNQDEFLVLWEAFPKGLDGTKKDRVLRFLLHIEKVFTQCSVCLEMSGHGLWIIYALKAFIYEYGEVKRGDCYESDSPTQSKPVNVQF